MGGDEEKPARVAAQEQTSNKDPPAYLHAYISLLQASKEPT